MQQQYASNVPLSKLELNFACEKLKGEGQFLYFKKCDQINLECFSFFFLLEIWMFSPSQILKYMCMSKVKEVMSGSTLVQQK